VQKEAEKKLKYKSLCIEIQRMWLRKYKIVPLIIRATGIVTNVWRKNLEAMLGNHSIDSLQKAAILGTSYIGVIREVLESETWSLIGGDRRSFRSNTRLKRPVTRDNNNNIIIIIIIIK
jgi:hypothetical protein